MPGRLSWNVAKLANIYHVTQHRKQGGGGVPPNRRPAQTCDSILATSVATDWIFILPSDLPIITGYRGSLDARLTALESSAWRQWGEGGGHTVAKPQKYQVAPEFRAGFTSNFETDPRIDEEQNNSAGCSFRFSPSAG